MATQQVKEALLTMRDVVRIANVSEMTVYNWRKGITRKKPLPTVEKPAGKRSRVFVKPKALVTWARQVGVELVPKEVKKLKLS